jgi:hypothetical protein
MPRSNTPTNAVRTQLYDHLGRPFKERFPKKLSASFLQRLYHKGAARVGQYDANGKAGDSVREELFRAQVPYVVMLLVYNSRFDISPTRREYYVYAPMDLTLAAKQAFALWRRWEKKASSACRAVEDLEHDYPKVDEAAFAIPLDTDEDFRAHWSTVKRHAHKAAGNPDDPIAYTCLNQDVLAFKTSDYQAGMPHRI